MPRRREILWRSGGLQAVGEMLGLTADHLSGLSGFLIPLFLRLPVHHAEQRCGRTADEHTGDQSLGHAMFHD